MLCLQWKNGKSRNRNVMLFCIVIGRLWIKQITVLIDTTDYIIKTEHRTFNQNFKNHSQKIILYSHIQYYRLIAMTLVSNTVLHRFTSLASHYAVPQLYSPLSASSLCSTLHTLKSSWQDYLLWFAGLMWSWLHCWNLLHCPGEPLSMPYLPCHCWLPLEVSLSSSPAGSVWHTGSLDVRGCTCCRITRRCLLLQYYWLVFQVSYLD